MKELVLMRERPLGPLMLAVHKLCVIGQTFIVTDVLVQRISVVSCMKRAERILLAMKDKGISSLMKVTPGVGRHFFSKFF